MRISEIVADSDSENGEKMETNTGTELKYRALIRWTLNNDELGTSVLRIIRSHKTFT